MEETVGPGHLLGRRMGYRRLLLEKCGHMRGTLALPPGDGVETAAFCSPRALCGVDQELCELRESRAPLHAVTPPSPFLLFLQAPPKRLLFFARRHVHVAYYHITPVFQTVLTGTAQ